MHHNQKFRFRSSRRTKRISTPTPNPSETIVSFSFILQQIEDLKYVVKAGSKVCFFWSSSSIKGQTPTLKVKHHSVNLENCAFTLQRSLKSLTKPYFENSLIQFSLVLIETNTTVGIVEMDLQDFLDPYQFYFIDTFEYEFNAISPQESQPRSILFPILRFSVNSSIVLGHVGLNSNYPESTKTRFFEVETNDNRKVDKATRLAIKYKAERDKARDEIAKIKRSLNRLKDPPNFDLNVEVTPNEEPLESWLRAFDRLKLQNAALQNQIEVLLNQPEILNSVPPLNMKELNNYENEENEEDSVRISKKQMREIEEKEIEVEILRAEVRFLEQRLRSLENYSLEISECHQKIASLERDKFHLENTLNHLLRKINKLDVGQLVELDRWERDPLRLHGQ